MYPAVEGLLPPLIEVEVEAGEDPPPIRGRGSPRVVPVVPPVDPVEDPVTEEEDEAPTAEPGLTNFMTSSGFHEVMGRMLLIMDSM